MRLAAPKIQLLACSTARAIDVEIRFSVLIGTSPFFSHVFLTNSHVPNSALRIERYQMNLVQLELRSQVGLGSKAAD